jgi:hypothetical protein
MPLKQVVKIRILKLKLCNALPNTSDLVLDNKDDQLAESKSILNRWKNNFCQVLNVHGDNYITWKYV